ncbi:MAG TPA: acetate/propionate family kinase [Hyphomicrobium sp.]|nr:acetate/propionate family kinase [Hyphomicrobium sp.]
MTRAVLVLNAGSSSIKFAIYEVDELAVLCSGQIDGIGAAQRFTATGSWSEALALKGPLPREATHEASTAWLLDLLRTRLPDLSIAAAGHRVVHGGARYESAVVVDDVVLSELDSLVGLAPLHEPHNLATIRAVAKEWGELPQVACFDTQFHRTQPRIAQLFALPRQLSDDGVLRYGFHGLSYEYIASVLPRHARQRAEGRVVVAHLGNGASMCAMKRRRSVASTMGFTALDGLMMGTRSGALDPGVILHLLQQKGMTVREVSDVLYQKSGLLGVSGISSDVRQLEASSDPRAAEALDLFAYRAVCELGSLVAVLGGLDVLVFTAGIGENSAAMRRRICAGAAWAGVAMDETANANNALRISGANSAVDVLVIPTDEEIVIARATRQLVCT